MKVEIYGRPRCEFCDAAIRFCETKKLKYSYFQLDVDYTVEELFEKVQFKTYPQIFINGGSVGGYTDFYKLMNETIRKKT